MNASLALSRPARAPRWLPPLLLPVLPALALMLHPNAAPGASSWLALAALAGVSLVLALGLPSMLDRLPRLARKEVEQLRNTWLISVVVVQLPVLLPHPGGDAAEVSAMFYLGTCLLLAVIPFGAEFQHRTLHALLAQPVDRRAIWRTKAGLLALALGMHGLLATLLGAAAYWVPEVTTRAGQPLYSPPPSTSSLLFMLGVFGVATLAAWGSGMLWSLVGRGIMPGLVFALALPVTVGVGGGLALSQVRDLISQSGGNADAFMDQAMRVLAWGILPAYGLACVLLAQRRWARLEATDTGDEGGHALFVRTRSSRGAVPGTSIRSPGSQLWRKEIRLQTVTLVLLGLALILGLVLRYAPIAPMYRDAFLGGQILLT
ncbi:MAG: hypothetical protein IT580_15370, partial [Verrucomicrobiales bacterium]|nr:hypothetical protein [Verrucomicrobiales bacterium]